MTTILLLVDDQLSPCSKDNRQERMIPGSALLPYPPLTRRQLLNWIQGYDLVQKQCDHTRVRVLTALVSVKPPWQVDVVLPERIIREVTFRLMSDGRLEDTRPPLSWDSILNPI